MTKSYSVGFIFMLNWRTKKGSQKIKIFYAQNSSNLISSDNFGAKTQETLFENKLREMARSLFYFYEYLPRCKTSES